MDMTKELYGSSIGMLCAMPVCGLAMIPLYLLHAQFWAGVAICLVIQATGAILGAVIGGGHS